MMKKNIKFDDVIELLGGFGKYQKRLYFLLVAPATWCAITTIITVFTVGEQQHRCQIPDLPNDTYKIQSVSHDMYINTSIPRSPDGMYDKCNFIVNKTENVTIEKQCDSWVYDETVFTSTLVSEFNLVCHRTIYQSHASMALFSGSLCGALINGVIGDMYGRKIAYCLSILLMFGGHLGTAFVPNYIGFAIMRFIGGFANNGYWNSAMILAFEMAGPGQRVWTGMVIDLVWCLGEYLAVLVAYFVRDWRTVQLILTAPLGIFLVYWKIIDESPRWLLNKGKHAAARKRLAVIAKVNNRKLPNDIDISDNDNNITESLSTGMKKLIKSKTMVVRFLILVFNWITVNAGYYGLTMNTGKIGGDVFVNFTISSTMELIGYILCVVLLDRIGRRAFHCSCMIIGGVACISTIFPVIYGNNAHQWIIITLSMIGKLGISAAFADIYFLSAELFPTSIRSFILGVSCIFGKIGSISSPYIADLGLLIPSAFGKALPLIVFGAMMLSSGVMALSLPETMKKKMPETFEDAVALKKDLKGKTVHIDASMEQLSQK